MSYHFLFALELEQQNSQVFYNSEAFVGHPIVVSVPEVKELISQFILTLNTVAVVEKETSQKGKETKGAKNNQPKTADSSPLALEKNLNETYPTPKLVAAEAYICKVKDLDKVVLNKLCAGIATYLSGVLSKVSAENLLDMELSPVFSGLREVVDLRNYLLTFVENPNRKKKYQEGFIYVMSV
jgi:hypothetical protein